MKDKMTPDEAADYLGISKGSLANMRSRGEGPAYMKPVGRIYYQERDLDAFLEKGFRPAGMGSDYECTLA